MSTQDLVLWHDSQPSGVPSARFCAMRSLNSPLWTSSWQAVHVLSVKWNGRILSVLPPRPTLWHSAQATATCANATRGFGTGLDGTYEGGFIDETTKEPRSLDEIAVFVCELQKKQGEKQGQQQKPGQGGQPPGSERIR